MESQHLFCNQKSLLLYCCKFPGTCYRCHNLIVLITELIFQWSCRIKCCNFAKNKLFRRHFSKSVHILFPEADKSFFWTISIICYCYSTTTTTTTTIQYYQWYRSKWCPFPSILTIDLLFSLKFHLFSKMPIVFSSLFRVIWTISSKY